MRKDHTRPFPFSVLRIRTGDQVTFWVEDTHDEEIARGLVDLSAELGFEAYLLKYAPSKGVDFDYGDSATTVTEIYRREPVVRSSK